MLPVSFAILFFLLIHMNLHEEVIADEVGLGKRAAFCVEAFKNKVRIVVAVEDYADQNEIADN
jgi:hypothetical protein